MKVMQKIKGIGMLKKVCVQHSVEVKCREYLVNVLLMFKESLVAVLRMCRKCLMKG